MISYPTVVFGMIVPMLGTSWLVPRILWTYRYPMWLSLFLMAVMATLFAALLGFLGVVVFDMVFDNGIPTDGPKQQTGEAYGLAILGWMLLFIPISAAVAIYSGFKYGRKNPEMSFDKSHTRVKSYGKAIGKRFLRVRRVFR